MIFIFKDAAHKKIQTSQKLFESLSDRPFAIIMKIKKKFSSTYLIFFRPLRR